LTQTNSAQEWLHPMNRNTGADVTKKDVIEYLEARVQEAGGQNALSREIDVDVSLINKALRHGYLTDKLLNGLGIGYRTATTYFFKKKR
jgi:hypothetical protein